jgi:Ca-activated chloride channel family protein
MKLRGLWLAVLVLVGLWGCGQRSEAPPPAAEPGLKVLATSDLKDIEPLVPMIEKATGVKLQLTFGGTIENTEKVLTGNTDAAMAWFATARYLLSDPQGQARVRLQEKIMLSPLVVGVSASSAKALGWDNPATAAKVSWKTITTAAAEGKLTYALSNPATSNQGYMALLGVVAAASGKPDALSAEDVDRQAIARFLKGYKLVGDNSSYLSERFVAEQGRGVNAFINYESWLLSLNRSGRLAEPLVLIYPHEGVATADYPLLLLQDNHRAAYQKVVDYLKGAEAQTWLAQHTLRRPILPEVAQAVKDVLPPAGPLVELTFSPSRALADRLVDAYLNQFRRPIASTFVLDTSGSMASDGRQQDLVRAMHYMAGGDNSMTGRLARLTSREQVWVLPFASQPGQLTHFAMPADTVSGKGLGVQQDNTSKARVLTEVRQYADSLRMTGGTALYDSVLQALQHTVSQRMQAPDYQYSVVALTDGMNNAGRDLAGFRQAYARLPEDVRAIPVFVVVFGEADEAELQQLVKLTGGKLFDARKTSLYNVFKDIRAYQ